MRTSFMLLNAINVMHCTYFHNLFYCFELKSWVSIPSFFSLCKVNVRSGNAANGPVHQGQLYLVPWGNILFVFCFMYKDQHITSEKTGVTVGTRFHFFFQSLEHVPFGLVMTSFNCLKKWSGAGEMAQWVVAFTTKPDHLTLIYGTHMVVFHPLTCNTHTQSSEST